jgi:hypothetical protein
MPGRGTYLAVALAIATAAAPGCARPPESRQPRCASLQALVEAAPAGSTVRVPACLYRETLTIDKPLTLLADPGAEVRGSDVWADGWAKTGSSWIRPGLPALGAHGECRRGQARCLWPQQVFLDGAPLLQVAAEPTTGQFSVMRDAVVLADDPRGRLVEVSTRDTWIRGRSDDVAIRGFVMRHAANDSQQGAISNEGHSRWTVASNRLSDSHGPAVSLSGGSDFRLIDNEISRSGQLGVHGEGPIGAHVRGNSIHHNNTEGFDDGWEAGGLKITRAVELTVEENHVYENDGRGVWCDFRCRGVTIRLNRIHDNSGPGINFELGSDGTFSENAVWENGWRNPEWGWGAGVLVQNSREVRVRQNLVAWNATGVSVIDQDREADHVPTVDVEVSENVLLAETGRYALAWLADHPRATIFDSASGNRGSGNVFGDDHGGESLVAWRGEQRGWTAFPTGAAGVAAGRRLSEADRRGLLAAKMVPPAPKSRPSVTS